MNTPHAARQECTDEALVVALCTGNVTAFERLFHRYKTSLMTFLTRVVHDRHKAEDLFQQVFLRVWQRADSLHQVRAFRTWIFQIAANAARDLLRYEKVRQHIAITCPPGDDESAAGLAPVAREPSPDEALVGDEFGDHLQQAIAALDEYHRTPFVLARINGLSYRRVADVLQVSEAAVRMRIHRALRQLATRLTGSGSAR